MRRALLGALALAAGALAVPASAAPLERVVVQSSSTAAAARAVERAGGTVVAQLPLVDGVAAAVPRGFSAPGATVTPDETLRPQATDTTTTGPAGNVYRQATGATNLPPRQRKVTVALIDTGIADVGGLGARTKTVPDPVTGQPARCANFTSEAGDCNDSFGHGTFLAGLITGMAPDADLVSVKIAGRNGAADTSQVLAAIQWVVSFKDQLGIDVLNLSLGTDSNHDSRKDPLNRAVQRAWRAGLVVVVSASNRGPAEGTISKPGDDPLVVTVGAVDDRGTPWSSDDTVPPFSGRGPVRQGTGSDTFTVHKPDVVAPGVGLVSLASPGSTIAAKATPVDGHLRGSGTSQAAAVTSGAVALLLERRALAPDEVKAALYVGARRLPGQPFSAVGAGLVNVSSALRADVLGFRQPDPRQDDIDPLDLSRGTAYVTSFACSQVRQELDPGAGCTYVSGQLTALATQATLLKPQRLVAFDAVEYTTGPWNGQSWYADQWAQGQSWYGQSWYGQSWYGQSWYSTDSETSYGAVVPGSTWYGVWR